MPITRKRFRSMKPKARENLEGIHKRVFDFLSNHYGEAFTPKELADKKEIGATLRQVHKSIEFLNRRNVLINMSPFWAIKRKKAKFVTKTEMKSLGGAKSWKRRR